MLLVTETNKMKALEKLDAVEAQKLKDAETALSLNEQMAQSKIVDLEMKSETETKLYASDKEKLEKVLEEWKEAAEKKFEMVETMERAVGTKERSDDEHPVLGILLSDLGHKKIYRASISKLASLPVWEKQRVFRVERAEKIAMDKLKQKQKIGLPGIITICESSDGSLKILDGQHRVAAMSVLAKLKKDGKGKVEERLVFDPEVVLVEVFREGEGEGGGR